MVRTVRFSYRLTCVIALSTVSICSAQQIWTDTNTYVSTANPQLNHSEVIIAADPMNAEHLLACSMMFPRQPTMVQQKDVAYVSFDGGTTWSASLEFGHTLGASDPSCAFGPRGSAFYAGLTFDAVEKQYKVSTAVYSSADSGKTWSLSSTLASGEREFLTAGQVDDNLYLAEEYVGASIGATVDGRATAPLVIYESNDQGKSFKVCAVIEHKGTGMLVSGYPGGILPDGAFVTSFSYLPEEVFKTQTRGPRSGASEAKVRVLRYDKKSADHLVISTVSDLYACNPATNSIPITSLALDSGTSIFRGRMYVAWPDSRSGRCEILLSSSADGGRTWSNPIPANDDEVRTETDSGPDDFHPVVEVSRKGVVGVLWYDRRENPDNLGWRPRFSASLDGGQTFLRSVGFGDSGMNPYQGNLLTPEVMSQGGAEPFQPGNIIRTTLGNMGHGITGGETAGLAADASGAFHALWVDNRTGVRQVWTARITVDGAVTKNGSNDLASFEDVSSDVTLLFSDIKLDKINRAVTADVYIENRSNFNIRCPLKLRALRLVSKIGVPKFTNSDNHQEKSGAVFDFSSLVPGGVLGPGERSAGKRVVIHLDHMSSEIPIGDYETLQEMVTIDSVVLGTHDTTTKP